MRWPPRWLIGDDDWRTNESDLAELYEFRRRQDGDRAARRWLARQRVLYPLHLFAERARAVRAGMEATVRHLVRDLIYSVRSLVRTPALAATIVVTVGIGLGATTAMVSVIRAVLIAPLPYAAPESLAWIYTDNPPYRFPFSVVDYRALEADHPAFSLVAGYQTRQVTVSEAARADRVTARAVTGSYFPVLGQRPAAGRLLDQADSPRDDRSVVLTHRYWAERFGRDPAVVGRAMTLDGTPYTIVGVAEPSDGPFEYGISLFTAARWPPPPRKGPFFIRVIGRMKPDVTPAAATAALRATNARLFPLWRASYQDEHASWGFQDLKSRVVGEIGTTLGFVLAAVGCVLLVACANAVNLLIARALSRRRELAIRGALGASRARLVQHLLAETGVLAGGAAVVGLVVAAGSIALITTYGGDYIPRIQEVRLSIPVLGWLGALSAASGLVMGLVPALHSSRLRLGGALGAGGRSSTEGPAARRVRRALVAAEFALATPLLVAAVLVLASLDRLSRVQVGIDAERVLTASVSLPGARYGENDAQRAFWDRAVERLRAIPGVESVAVSDSRPPQDAQNTNNFDLEDRPVAPGQNQPLATWVTVSPDFFKTVGLRLEQGRLFEPRDREGDSPPPVVVVDRAWADRFFPGESVIGRRLHEGGCTTCPWTTVVGLVSNVKFSGLDATDDGTIYSPMDGLGSGYFVLRAAGDPAQLVSSLRHAVADLDPGLALTDVATGDELLVTALTTPRYLSVLVGIFAIAALVMSVVGIYGVMAHFVQQHSRDIGIRLALGGEPAAMRRDVVVRGLRLVAAGVALGIGAAFFTAGLIRSLLFGIAPTDPLTLAAVPLALCAVAAIACLVPAGRAARLDPATILRES